MADGKIVDDWICGVVEDGIVDEYLSDLLRWEPVSLGE